jgi:hypothetical protein
MHFHQAAGWLQADSLTFTTGMTCQQPKDSATFNIVEHHL